MIVYFDTSQGISAGLALGALLDAGADGALVQRILGIVTLPRIALMFGKDRVGAMTGTAVSVAIGPVPRETRLLGVLHALEQGTAPLAVRTWGGGMLARLLDAEAAVRGVARDAAPLDDLTTVADLLAVSAALAALRAVRVYAAPLAWRGQGTGDRGQGSAEHARLSTQYSVLSTLLEEADWPDGDGPPVPVTAGGAAILAALAEPEMPALRLGAVGYGIGADPPHLLRCMVGEPFRASAAPPRDGAPAHAHPHDSA